LLHCRTELRHIDEPRRTAEGGALLQVGPFERLAVQTVRVRGGKLKAAADLLPGSGERGQQRDGLHGQSAALTALHAVVEANHRGAHRGVLASQRDNIFGGNPGQRGGALGRILLHLLAQIVEAGGVALDVIGVAEIFRDQHVHHAERQRRVAARVDGKMLVGKLPGADCGADR
jgi:hypothetical protein